jgi:hypothetical protein
MIVTGENGSTRRKPSHSATSFNHKYHVDWPAIESGPTR